MLFCALENVVRAEVAMVKKCLDGARATGSTRCGKLGPGRSQRGGALGEGIGASGARTTLPTTGYDGASKHQGNAFATHPLYLKNENKSNSRRTSQVILKLIQINLSRRFKANQIWCFFLL